MGRMVRGIPRVMRLDVLRPIDSGLPEDACLTPYSARPIGLVLGSLRNLATLRLSAPKRPRPSSGRPLCPAPHRYSASSSPP